MTHGATNRRGLVLACVVTHLVAFSPPTRPLPTSLPKKQGNARWGVRMEMAPVSVPAPAPTSVSAGSINLVKSIVGAGVLALPSGIGAFANSPSAVLPATFFVTTLGAASAYSFTLLGRLCAAYDVTSYRDAWSKSVGEKSAWLVTACCTLTPLLACLAYSIIIGDSFSSLITAANPGPNVQKVIDLCGGARRGCIWTLALVALLPLCSLKSLAALAPTSALGTAGLIYTALFMCKRALDGTYGAAGKFAGLAAAPIFGKKLGLTSPRLGVFFAMLGTAYMAHFNAPSFFEDTGGDLKKFNAVVKNGFAASIAINVAVMCAGFLTFGAASKGLVLNNYASTDALAAIARLVFGASIVFTFPLVFSGAKDGVRAVFRKLLPTLSGERLERCVVVAPLTAITAVALVLDDVGVVVSLTGALMGSAVIYVLPGIMLLKAGAKLPKQDIEKKITPLAMLATGAVSAVLGLVTTLA